MEPVIKVPCSLHQKGVCPEAPKSGRSIQGKASLGGGAEAQAGVAFLTGSSPRAQRRLAPGRYQGDDMNG